MSGPYSVRAIPAALILLASAVVLAIPEAVRAQTLRDPTLRVDLVVSGLSAPTTMAFIGPNDLLVLQKNDGRVRRVTGGVLQPNAVLDLAVDSASERGLLGIALHPNFPTTPFVYLYVTESSTGGDTVGSPPPIGNRVYRFTWNGSSLVSPVLLLSLPAMPGPNHNGGVILFGPDGKLYIVIGDLNRNGQLQNIATGPPPDDTGVILRLNDDGSVPFDNPFASLGENLAKYFAYGIRNSFGMAFDPVTGKLWMTENGPDVYDEINLVEPGFNSGWNRIMGPVARDAQGTSDLVFFPGSRYDDPKFSWFDTVAPTGIVFLASGALGAAYTNDLFVGDINGGVLYHFVPNSSRNGFVFSGAGLGDLVADSPTELDETIIGTGFGGIVDLKVGPDGRLYVLSFSGSIFVISSSAPGSSGLTVTSSTVTAGGGMDVAWTGIPTPTSTDWIGLYTPGAPDTAFLAWTYVSCTQTPGAARAAGACPFLIPAGLAPGTYELRLLANNVFTRLATSAPFTVTATGPLLSVSPGAVNAGGSVTATWSGITAPTSTDWIGLYTPGAADTAFLAWTYVSCTQTPGSATAAGACTFVIPSGLVPGVYELRLLANNVFTRLATSGVLTVTPATGLTASTTVVTAGGGMDVAWTGIATPTSTDWIGLYTPGAPDTAFLAWSYVSCTQTLGAARAAGACPFLIPAGLAPGTYELRLLANNVFTRLATSGAFTVTSTGPLLSVSPGSVSAGGSVTATWSGIAAPTPRDWIGLYAPGTADTALLAWTYVSCAQTPNGARAAGACAFSIPPGLVPGVYELRLLANNVFTRLATTGVLFVGP